MRRAPASLAAVLTVVAGGGVAAAADAAKRGGRCTARAHCARFAKGRAGAAGAPGRAGWSELAPTDSTAPGPSAPGAGSAPLPRRLAVDENEYSVLPSRNPVGAGDVQFHVNNFGQDEHDLTITDGTTQFGQVLVASGASADLTATLGPGNYKLYCSLLNGLHDGWGMHATLTVR